MLERTRQLMEDKREAVAAALLAWAKIEEAIRLAAAAGGGKVTLTPSAPIKLRHTAAAIDAAARLTKAGFRATWTEHRSAIGGPAGDQLEVEW